MEGLFELDKNDYKSFCVELISQRKFNEAYSLYERALEIDEKVYGPDHPDVARDLGGMAMTLGSKVCGQNEGSRKILYHRVTGKVRMKDLQCFAPAASMVHFPEIQPMPN